MRSWSRACESEELLFQGIVIPRDTTQGRTVRTDVGIEDKRKGTEIPRHHGKIPIVFYGIAIQGGLSKFSLWHCKNV